MRALASNQQVKQSKFLIDLCQSAYQAADIIGAVAIVNHIEPVEP